VPAAEVPPVTAEVEADGDSDSISVYSGGVPGAPNVNEFGLNFTFELK